MAARQFLEHGHRTQVGRRLEHRDDLLVEDPFERIQPAAPAGRLLAERESRIGFEPVCRGGAEAGLRGCGLQSVALSEVHVSLIW